MDTFLQALPLLLLLTLLGSGRVAPAPACLIALTASLPGIATVLPPELTLSRFLASETARAAYLGALPVAILSGGLLFSLVAAPRAGGPVPPSPRRAYLTILAGSFVESVTGFGVGAVVTLGGLRSMGITGVPAGGMAVLSMWLAPWGGLGPGLALGAALAGRPLAETSLVTAIPHSAWLLVAPPVLWSLLRRAGLPVPARERLVQFGLQLALAALVLLGARFLPAETVGLVASGAVLLPALWWFAPPRDAQGWERALSMIGPWALLTLCLLLARSWHAAPAWQPFPGLPALPVTHVAVVLWAVSLLFLAFRADALARLHETLTRMRRPGMAMMLYVLLGRWIAGSGVAAALAHAIAAGLGPLAPYAIPPLGMLGGVVTGSNVGAASAMMPLQASLGIAAGLPPWLAPGLNNSAGSAGASFSFAATALICGLLADGTRPPAIWRAVLPLIIAVPLIGWATVAVLRGLA
ncbi:L-lactate permease [Roseomonas sp. SSH11]|uniref:L-lactate permease n=1 Tax=Pararoseomonas baculiformis TaxID=2820812 RepID=A0ABS4ADW0_9PROT|nr:L-lactate permease [Pararoseomonas baculiformis]MBP0445192.1 L-lactate permease [Pararoseomonas baculiformis]